MSLRSFVLVPALAAGVVAAGCGAPGSLSGPSNVVAAAADDAAEAKITSPLPSVACKGVTDVKLQLLTSLSRPHLRIRATYIGDPGGSRCAIPPTWESTPEGLVTPTRDPFVASLQKSPVKDPTLVFASAPNGARGKLEVRW